MGKKSKKKEETDYEGDTDQDELYEAKQLEPFGEEVKKRLDAISETRKSEDNVLKKFRRLDSLARLSEGKATCSAVYYHVPTETLWLANNKVHSKSHEKNKWIDTTKFVFKLVSDESLDVTTILDQLTDLIFLNISQEKWQDLGCLKEINFDIKANIREWLIEIFSFERTTKKWEEHASSNLEFDDKEQKVILKIIRKVSRTVRDLLKIRDFLLNKNKIDPLSKGIVSAIRKNKFLIIHSEGNGVHAEMRILNKIIESKAAPSYIGISKLCCGHCALAMNSFLIPHRGVHGQRFFWPIPDFIRSDKKNFKKYIGKKAAASYKKLSKKRKEEAKQMIENMKTHSRHNRDMYADDSDSDIEFGVSFKEESEDLEQEVYKLNLKNVWKIRSIKNSYPREMDRLISIGFNISDILELYEQPDQKFKEFSSESFFYLIREIAKTDNMSVFDVFEEMSCLFDENRSFFYEVIHDEDFVIDNGLKDILDRRARKSSVIKINKSDDSDSEISSNSDYNSGVEFSSGYYSYDRIKREIESENECSYEQDSDDSQNCRF